MVLAWILIFLETKKLCFMFCYELFGILRILWVVECKGGRGDISTKSYGILKSTIFVPLYDDVLHVRITIWSIIKALKYSQLAKNSSISSLTLKINFQPRKIYKNNLKMENFMNFNYFSIFFFWSVEKNSSELPCATQKNFSYWTLKIKSFWSCIQ
jgi:hypothetical protein